MCYIAGKELPVKLGLFSIYNIASTGKEPLKGLVVLP